MENEYKIPKQTSWKPFFRQLLVASMLWSSYFVAGMSMGTPTVVIPQLRRQANSTEAVSAEMASWLTSIIGYSGVLGVFMVAFVCSCMGRRMTLAILGVNTLAATTIIYFSSNALHIFVSQFLIGLTYASQLSAFLMIITEYSSPKYRGIFLTFKSATFFWGIWIANAIGIFTHYKYIGLVGMVICIYNVICSFIIPESPYWLAFKGRYEECSKAYRLLNGFDENTEKDLIILIESQKLSADIEGSKKSIIREFKVYYTAIKQPHIYKPLLYCFLVFIVYHASGKLVCAVYAIEMMKKVTGNQSAVYIGVLVLDGVTVLGMYAGSALSKILTRRVQQITSSIMSTIFLFTNFLYLYLVKLSVVPENPYVIISLLMAYSLSVACGPLIMATTISAELLPIQHRTFCSCMYAMICCLLLGTVIKISPYLFNSYGFHGAFLVYGFTSTVCIIIMYKYLPETKDKTLHEIQAMFVKIEEKDYTQRTLDRLIPNQNKIL